MGTKDIIIFTQFYPYTYYDTYFQRELFELSKYYSRIFLISANPDSTILNPIPPNAKVFRFVSKVQEQNKQFLFRHLFTIEFLKELIQISKTVTPKNFVHAVWYAFSSLEKSDHYKKFITKLLRDENISAEYLTIYSYWMLEHAHAAGSMKHHNPKIKVIVRAHGSDLYFERSPISYLPLKKLIFDRADAIFFISETGKKYFQSFHRIQSKSFSKLKVSRLGLQAANFPQLKNQPQKPFYRIVSNGYVQPLKRIDLIAKALSEIKDLKIEWTHFGGLHHRTEEFELFKKVVREALSTNPAITFTITGDVNNKEIISFYEQNFIDLFINVSTTEGIPVSIMEAFSFGIPAIATSVGGNPEIVNNENGILLPSDLNKTVLAIAIRDYLQKPSVEKERFRLNAFNTWKEKFNAEINYPKFVQEVLALGSATL